jgi:hypothetical protein
LKRPNFGRGSLAEVNEKLATMGLRLGMRLPYWTSDSISKNLKAFDKNIQQKRMQLAREFRKNFGANVNSLEKELGHLTHVLNSERNSEIILKHLGWDGRGTNTLQAVGLEYGVTRERVRQIRNKHYKRVRRVRRTVYMPILRRALKIVHANSPALADEIEAKLVRYGISQKAFRLDGLLTAAEFFGLEVPFRIVKLRKKRIVVPQEGAKFPQLILQMARKVVEKRGVATVSDIVAHGREETGHSITTDFVCSTLSLLEGFKWLNEVNGWFWLSSVPIGRNRLLNHIRKILSVADDGISISDLRSGVGRSHRMEGFAPPRRVLLELCRQLPWCRVEGDKVIADPRLDWKNILNGEIESVMCEILKNHGPVMGREEFEKLCLSRGMNQNSFYTLLTYSPIITKYAAGVYGLRGTRILPGLVQSLKPKRKPGRVIKDFGWTPKGKIWIALKLSEAILKTGVFGIPAAMREYLQGNFVLIAAGGASIGILKVKDSSAWSLSSFFRRRGGEPDDYLVLTFDVASREVAVLIGDLDLLDNFRPKLRKIEEVPRISTQSQHMFSFAESDGTYRITHSQIPIGSY